MHLGYVNLKVAAELWEDEIKKNLEVRLIITLTLSSFLFSFQLICINQVLTI